MKFNFAFFLVILMFVVSCSKNNTNNEVLITNESYFPIDTTKEFLYAVDSISFNSNNKTIDTFLFYLKTKFINSFIDNKGIKTYRLQRLAKYKNADDYKEISSHFVQFNNKQYIYFEDNLPLLKAVFPLNLQSAWNYNLYNREGTAKSRLLYLNQNFVAVDTTYNNTLRINENIDKDFIFDIEKWSIYQNNVGLVYSKNKKTETQTNQSGVPIESGFDMTQKLISVTP